MITGAHVMIYSPDAAADRAMLRDVLALPHIAVGDGWLIFWLPATEAGIHPTDGPGTHELYLTCDSLDALIAMLAARGIGHDPPFDASWGRALSVHMPSGMKLGIYEPRHGQA